MLIFDFRAWAIGVPFRKISPVPMCSRFFPIFSSIRLSASGFMWRSLIQVDLSFVQRDKIGSIWILLHLDCQLEFVENFVFFPLCDLTLCQRSSDHRYVGLFLGLQFYSIGLPVCHSLLLCSIEWGQGWGFPQKFWHIKLRIFFAILFFFVLHSRWSWELIFPSLWRVVFEFWWVLHWIFRLLLARWPFLLY